MDNEQELLYHKAPYLHPISPFFHVQPNAVLVDPTKLFQRPYYACPTKKLMLHAACYRKCLTLPRFSTFTLKASRQITGCPRVSFP